MKRGALLFAAIVVVGCGLVSRWDLMPLPAFMRSYAGDTLWATMMVLLVGLVRPRWRAGRICGMALAIACAVEFSQLYRAPWIDWLRGTVPGHLVLGQGFLWSDLWCYLVGVVIGFGLLRAMPQVDS